MADTFAEIMETAMKVVNPIIQKNFEDNHRTYKRFRQQNDPHTWIGNIKEYSKQLESTSDLPHLILHSKSNKPYEYQITNNSCQDCIKMFNERQRYQAIKQAQFLLKENDRKSFI